MTEIVLQKHEGLARQLIDHMGQRIREAAERTSPYPHLYVTQIFPSEFYAELLELLPGDECLSPVGEKHYGPDATSNRNHLMLDDSSLQQLEQRQRDVWAAVRDALRSDELKRAVYHKLRQGLAYRFGVGEEEVEALPGFASPRLYRESNGYSIAPHPDTRKKVVTFQLALPRDESQLHLGTALYRRSLAPQDLVGRPRGFRGFRQVGQYPFAPNSAFAFAVINTMKLKSWHGREPLQGETGTRNTILNVYYARAA